MAFTVDTSGINLSINSAIELSVSGGLKKAFQSLNIDHLSQQQKEKIYAILNWASNKGSAEECSKEKFQLLSLLSSPEAAPVKKSKTKRLSESGFDVKKAIIKYAQPNFLEKCEIALASDDFTSGVLNENLFTNEKVHVRHYHNKYQLMNDYNFHENGFELCKLSDKLSKYIPTYASNPFDNDNKELLIEHMANFISTWAREKGFVFDVVVPLGILVYRAEVGKKEMRASAPVHLAHVDYHPDSRESSKDWKARVKAATGFEECSYAGVFNLWISFNEDPTQNTITFLDKTSFDVSKDLHLISRSTKKDSQYFDTVRTLEAKPEHNWVACNNIGVGYGYVFNTFGTPHSAIKLNCASTRNRESADCRFALVVKPKPPKIRVRRSTI